MPKDLDDDFDDLAVHKPAPRRPPPIPARPPARERDRDRDDVSGGGFAVLPIVCTVFCWIMLGVGGICVLASFSQDTIMQQIYFVSLGCFAGIAARVVQAQGQSAK